MKKILAAVLAGVLVASLGLTAFAAEWKQNTIGKWYEHKDGSSTYNGWEWIDDNNDGLAECYHFDERGYLDTRKTISDGSVVDGNGAWTVNGQVQHENVAVLPQKIVGAYSLNGATVPSYLDGCVEIPSVILSDHQKMFVEAGTPEEDSTVTVTLSAVPLSSTRQSFEQLRDRLAGSKASLSSSVGNKVEELEETVDGVYYYVVSGENGNCSVTTLYGVSQNTYVQFSVTMKQGRMSARDWVNAITY